MTVLMTVHFLKRCLECIFVHKYSGSMPIATSIFVGFFYTCLAYGNIRFTNAGSGFDKSLLTPGLVLFAIGLAGNFYHHYLLANLRAPGEKTYKVPQGGMFSLVSTPHYFFELIGWAGVTLIAQHASVCIFFAAMVVYLSDRAVAQTQWNLEKFRENYPKGRKHIIPFFF